MGVGRSAWPAGRGQSRSGKGTAQRIAAVLFAEVYPAWIRLKSRFAACRSETLSTLARPSWCSRKPSTHPSACSRRCSRCSRTARARRIIYSLSTIFRQADRAELFQSVETGINGRFFTFRDGHAAFPGWCADAAMGCGCRLGAAEGGGRLSIARWRFSGWDALSNRRKRRHVGCFLRFQERFGYRNETTY